MIGLRDQIVLDATSFEDARSRHRWRIPADYGIVEDCLDRHPRDGLCLLSEDEDGRVERWTWGAMLDATNRFANALRAQGVGRGDVVAVHLPQRPETIITHLACFRLGAVGLPISKLFGPDGIRYRLANSRARAIVLEGESLGKLDGLRAELPSLERVICVDGPAEELSFATLLEKGSDRFERDRPPAAEDPVLLMYTSGTTGDPKGVLHVARGLLGHNGVAYGFDFFHPGDVYYSAADWAWAGGLLTGLLAIWPHGVPVLAYRSRSRFDPEKTLDLVSRHRATCGFYPPTALRLLREVPQLRERFPDLALRAVVSGGEPVTAELFRFVREELRSGMNQGYGQTEANFVIGTCRALDDDPLEPIGRAYPGHEMAVVDADGRPVASGAIGEIALRADDPVVMKDYVGGDPDVRAEKIRGGWCFTGDLGRCDERGYFHFQSRTDDVIKTSGYRVGPAEVEAAISALEGVAGAAVIGVPDARRGQAIKAFVLLRTGVDASPAFAKTIQDHVRARLAAHETPREIEFVTDLPLTVTGKVRRADLRKREEEKRA